MPAVDSIEELNTLLEAADAFLRPPAGFPDHLAAG